MNTAAQNFEIFKSLLLKQVDVINQFYAKEYGVAEISPENIHEIAEFHFFGDVAVLDYPSPCNGEYNAMIENAEDAGVSVITGEVSGSAYILFFEPIDESELQNAYAINQQVGNGIYALEAKQWFGDRLFYLKQRPVVEKPMLSILDLQKNNKHKVLIETRTSATESDVMLHVACYAVVDDQMLYRALEVQYALHAQTWEGNYQHLTGEYTLDIQRLLKQGELSAQKAWMESEPLKATIKAQLDFLNEMVAHENLSDNEITGIKAWEANGMKCLLNDTDLPALDLNNNIVNASHAVLTLAHKVLSNCLYMAKQCK